MHNTLPDTLDGWLAWCERLHPQTIALGLERVRRVAQRMALAFGCPLVTVAGTNGKGSTCALMEAIALQGGWRVGVYSSPHLVAFEERCRVQGEVVQAQALLPHFAAVERARVQGQAVALTYYEFTTLAILHLLASSRLDLVILEVGLGGRLDATNMLDADCAVITSIDIDHVEYLGDSRERIGLEKAGIMRAGRPVVVGDPAPPHSVVQHAQDVGADLWLPGRDFRFTGTRQQWNWAGRARRYNALAYPALRGVNQLANAAAALAALEALHARLPVTAQAVRAGLATVQLPARFQIVPGQPALVLDVAHNPHAVAALAANLDAMGFFPRTHAVFGAMQDKDIATMLARIAPLVDHWYLADLPEPRACPAAALRAQVQALAARADGPPASSVACFASPQQALHAAQAAADPADRIVVFGSFVTVGEVLRHGVPRPGSRHLH